MSTVMTHRIEPSIDKSRGLIAIDEFSRNPMIDVQERFSRQVVDTRDKMIRDALIALGWTPPREAGAERAAGEEAGERCLSKAQRGGFDTKAAASAMLACMARGGSFSGEDLVLAAKRSGHAPHDDRAFGPVIAALARRGAIKQVGECTRKRGNGTSGGRLYTLGDATLLRA